MACCPWTALSSGLASRLFKGPLNNALTTDPEPAGLQVEVVFVGLVVVRAQHRTEVVAGGLVNVLEELAAGRILLVVPVIQHGNAPTVRQAKGRHIQGGGTGLLARW